MKKTRLHPLGATLIGGVVWIGSGAAAAEAPAARFPDRLVEGARVSIGKAPTYDGSYARIGYPGGDPGWNRGACVDVVIRGFRHAGIDLQSLVAEDAEKHPRAYEITKPDRNIDHRRVRNLKRFFERHAATLPPEVKSDWLPGDLVIWDLVGGSSPNHIGIVSERKGASGFPLVIHHYRPKEGFSGFPSEDDCLGRWRILGHYRWVAGGGWGARADEPGPGSQWE